MALDTVFSSTDKGMTDAELRLLKLPENSKREICTIRREATERVHSVMVLHRIATHCRDAENPNVFPPEDPVTEKICDHPLFYDTDLNLDTWMLVYLLDHKFMSKFGNPKIHTLFNVSDKELEQHYPKAGVKNT